MDSIFKHCQIFNSIVCIVLKKADACASVLDVAPKTSTDQFPYKTKKGTSGYLRQFLCFIVGYTGTSPVGN
ncbi:MAG TPA: hypothetical protein PKL31_13285 [Fulvivirga sp.]|nr:hypothetical protein [Fulvivirga sp.]